MIDRDRRFLSHDRLLYHLLVLISQPLGSNISSHRCSWYRSHRWGSARSACVTPQTPFLLARVIRLSAHLPTVTQALLSMNDDTLLLHLHHVLLILAKWSGGLYLFFCFGFHTHSFTDNSPFFTLCLLFDIGYTSFPKGCAWVLLISQALQSLFCQSRDLMF